MSWRGLREARRYLLGLLVLEGAALAVGLRLGGRPLLLGVLGAMVFFRDPERPLDPDEDVVYAAADGVVTVVDRVGDPWIEGEDAARVSTFLSLHNVHVTRSPTAGRIAAAEELPGGFRPAFLRRAEDNRRRRLAIEGRRGRVVVAQVAGMVARRISAWVEPGDALKPGQRLGLIHFGSRVDVLLPADEAEVLVEVGDRVRAGTTALARYRLEPAAVGARADGAAAADAGGAL